MIVSRIYNNPNNIILNFTDSDLKQFHYPPIINNDNISYTCADVKYRNAFFIEHKGKGNHCLRINWSKITMSAPIESFIVQIKYGTSVRITAQVQIKFPLLNVDLKCSLSISQGTWGVNPNCILNIKPTFPNTESWKYNDRQVCLSFSDDSGNFFFPDNRKNNYIFSAKKGISVPLGCSFPNEIIKETIQKNIHFSIDQHYTSLPFKFNPVQISINSYCIEIIRISDDYQYGTPDKKVFKCFVKPQNRYISVDKVEFRFRSPDFPFYHKEIDGEHFLFICAKNIKWIGCDTTYNFEIFVNNICYSKEIHISSQEPKTSNYVQLVPGKSPSLTLYPSNSIELTHGQNGKLGLEIYNPSQAPITISKVCTSNSELANILCNKNFVIQPEAKKTVNIDLLASKICKKEIEIKAISKETEIAKTTLNLIVKDKEDSHIAVEYTHDDNYNIIRQKKLLSNEKCGIISVTELHESTNVKSYVNSDFRIISEDFDVNYLYGTNKVHTYELSLKPGAFTDLKKIRLKEDNGHFYVLSWEYHDQKGELYIPIKKASLYRFNIHNSDSISFPNLEEDRKIIIGDIEINEPHAEDCIIDNNQYLVVESPFYLKFGNTESNKIKLEQQQNINLGIDIEQINGVTHDTKNIAENIQLDLSIICQGEIINSKQIFSKKFEVIPINEKPKRNVFFETTEGNEIRVFVNAPNTASVNILEHSEDVVAKKLGDIKVRNLSKIPFKDNSLKCIIKDISATCGSIDFLHEDSRSYINNEIVIFNGDEDFIIPIYIDYIGWKQKSSIKPFCVKLELESSKEKDNKELISKNSIYKVDIELIHQFIDDIFSLDLGTTGIVIAKEKDGMQEIIKLDDDSNDPIEKDDEIISSHSMLIAKESLENENSELILSPTGNEYYGNTQKKRFRLVPSKFIIGQERIPYLKEFYENNNLNKKTKLFSAKDSTIDLAIHSDDKEANRNTISEVIASLYKNIFSRFSQDASKIKKLVITYPNTYTIENLESIGTILREELKLNLKGQVTFVPESDAVAAYYFDQIIMHRGGFFDKKGAPKEVENVIIYDMGAGTLDLSLISFIQKNGTITASIINKIGIPLAGNYLDYIICKTLLDSNIIERKLTEKHNTIKEISIGIKQSYEPQTKIKEQSPNWYKENNSDLKIEDQTYSDIFNESIKQFLVTCSSTILELLIPQNTKIDTIVFSGRASKFASIRECVKSSLTNMMGGKEIFEDKLVPTSNCGDYLKTCVAIGALKYQSFFNNNANFRIENKNLYSKIAVVYFGKNNERYDVKVKFLIDPQSEIWDDAEFINGTWCKEFYAKELISDHLVGRHLYYVQTCLDEIRLQGLFRKVYLNDISSKDDLNWAFVNILFKKRVTDSKPFEVSLRTSKDNKIIERKIGTELLQDTKLLENVEENILYRRSMWPFITEL